jgi:hypothetical protein
VILLGLIKAAKSANISNQGLYFWGGLMASFDLLTDTQEAVFLDLDEWCCRVRAIESKMPNSLSREKRRETGQSLRHSNGRQQINQLVPELGWICRRLENLVRNGEDGQALAGRVKKFRKQQQLATFNGTSRDYLLQFVNRHIP